MKRIISIIFVAGLLSLVASCNKETIISQDSEKDVVVELNYISASTEDSETKATVDNETATFNWLSTDAIALWDKSLNDNAGGYVTSSETIPGSPATVATFAVSISEDNRENYAVFPASIVDAANASETELRVILPGEYNVTDINSDNTPCPMISYNSKEKNLCFYQIASILRFQVNSIPPSATYLTFDFGTNKVQGNFGFSNKVDGIVKPGKSYIETESASEGNNIITVKGNVSNATTTIVSALGETGWKDGLVLNIPVPTGSYSMVTVTAWNTAGRIYSMTRKIKVNSTWAASRRSARKVKTSLPGFAISISTTVPRVAFKKVQFSKSNLKAVTNNEWSTYSFSFMNNSEPWTTIEANGSVGDDYEGSATMSLFGWCTSGFNHTAIDESWIKYAPNNTDNTVLSGDTFSNNTYGYGPNVSSAPYWNLSGDNLNGDWGINNKIGEEAKGTWRVLTRDECRYLLSMNVCGEDDTRWRRGGIPYGRATVSGCKGLIIAPDYFSDPVTNGAEGSEGAFKTGISTSWSSNVYSTLQWSEMDLAGAVFLPCAGSRGGNTVSEVGDAGYYWTCTGYNKTHAIVMGFADNDKITGPAVAVRRYLGASVRLVRDIE